MDTKFENLQQVYDHVCRHLAAQGFRAIDQRNGICKYRDGRGASCAVGCLLPDDEYSASFEGKPVHLILNNRDVFGCVPTVSDICSLSGGMQLLMDLQCVHDDASNWSSGDALKRALSYTAIRSRLDAYILDRLDFGTIVPNRLD